MYKNLDYFLYIYLESLMSKYSFSPAFTCVCLYVDISAKHKKSCLPSISLTSRVSAYSYLPSISSLVLPSISLSCHCDLKCVAYSYLPSM
jgi:hypothetical protein